ncbi:hypothetical protein AB0M83_27170 [Amycolatopsis sp. NPDC051106]|uniref:hypothetical protein n=1 Tax=Amycolatopsis sp. NPDC051106 TaxID=3157100 RepID=UPI0034498768
MQIDQLFTVESVLTLQGATAATLLVPHVVQSLAGRRYTELWRLRTAFVVAMALALLTAAIADGSPLKWLIAVLNGCLVFASAVGINQTVIAPEGRSVILRGGQPRTSQRSWLRRA